MAEAAVKKSMWDVVDEEYYPFKEGSLSKVHIKALKRVDSNFPPKVYVNIANPNEFGALIDSKNQGYPFDPEALRNIGKAIIDFAKRIENNGHGA